MFTPKSVCACCFLILCLLSPALAQVAQPDNPGQATVTASATAERVRFTGPNTVVQMHVQVYDNAGQLVFDVSSKGNVLDWTLQDSGGARLLPGSYLSVVTVKTLSGKLSQRVGLVSIQEKQLELQRVDAAQLTAGQQQAVGPIEENSGLTILQAGEPEAATVVAHDGTQGEVTRSRGALSFRLGDFFSGKDTEQMRLTEEGNLGIGTDTPQAKLDVAGMIRTSKGIEFANTTDGSDATNITKLTTTATGSLQQTMADGTVVTNATGTGTQNQVAKWTDNAGTLGDAVITETSGNVGIGTASPANKLDVVRGTAGQMAKGFFEMSSFEFDADAKFGVYSSASSAPSAAVTFGSTVLQANNKFPGFELQYIYSPTPAQNQARFNYIERSANGAVANFAANLLTINGNGNVTLNPVTLGVTASPRLGIGTPSPQSPLDVAGHINTSTQYNIGGNRVLTVTATSNTFAGIGAGTNSTGDTNSFFGLNAGGGLNNSGNANSFFGERAGAANTTGFGNAFFGNTAGISNTTGRTNAFFGVQTGQSNTTGVDNSFFGVQAGFSNTIGNNNTFFGRGAGSGNTQGAGNVFLGLNAGAANTTGNSNSFFGTDTNAGSDNLSFATAIGSNAVVSTSNTIQLGRANGADLVNISGSLNTNGQYNIGGNRVLSVSGTNNIFAGVGAGPVNSGSSNAFFGRSAGLINSSGGSNSFFGASAGSSNTTGSNNTFIGNGAGGANTGSENSFLGWDSGLNNTQGGSNLFLGASSGLSNIGESNNTFVGAASNGGAGITNATAIGSNAQVTQSNSLVLGSINTVNGATANTNVGIGRTAPDAPLSVAGPSTQIHFGTNLQNDGGGYLVSTSESVSILSGGARLLSGSIWIAKNGSASLVQNAAGSVQFFTNSGLTINSSFTPSERMRIDNNGDVGIGIVNPQDKLQVAGDIRVGTGTNGCVKDADATLLTGTCSSDARFKRDITPFPKLLERLVQLQPVDFYWRTAEYPEKSFGSSRSFGLVAQEVEQVLPELVTEDEKGFKAVRYHKLPLLMLQGLKELKAENDFLKHRLEEQESRLRKLETKLEK
jgi:endosialidase-like protein